MGTVDTRLLSKWQASWRRERAGRLLPASWHEDERPEARAATELWKDLLAARVHVVGGTAVATLADDDR